MSNSSIYDQYYSSEKQTTHYLLSQEDYETCLQLAAGNKPWSQRAQVLLALDMGLSEAVASERSGLRITQVKYWLNKYQKEGKAIFPTEMFQGIDESAAEAAESTAEETRQKGGVANHGKKSKKTKKSKKEKDKKKGKKKGKKKKTKTQPGKGSKKAKKAKSREKKK